MFDREKYAANTARWAEIFVWFRLRQVLGKVRKGDLVGAERIIVGEMNRLRKSIAQVDRMLGKRRADRFVYREGKRQVRQLPRR